MFSSSRPFFTSRAGEKWSGADEFTAQSLPLRPSGGPRGYWSLQFTDQRLPHFQWGTWSVNTTNHHKVGKEYGTKNF